MKTEITEVSMMLDDMPSRVREYILEQFREKNPLGIASLIKAAVEMERHLASMRPDCLELLKKDYMAGFDKIRGKTKLTLCTNEQIETAIKGFVDIVIKGNTWRAALLSLDLVLVIKAEMDKLEFLKVEAAENIRCVRERKSVAEAARGLHEWIAAKVSELPDEHQAVSDIEQVSLAIEAKDHEDAARRWVSLVESLLAL